MTIAPRQIDGAYNAAADLICRNLDVRPNKIAFIDSEGAYSYAAVAALMERYAAGLVAHGLRPGDRLVLCMFDGINFVAGFLGAIKAGIVPIALNTLLKPDDYSFVLRDSGATAALVSASLAPVMNDATKFAGWGGHLFVDGVVESEQHGLARLLECGAMRSWHAARAEDVAFWLYSSGSTGPPKGTPHRHASLIQTAELFAQSVLGVVETDIIFSAAKLFFAYGLGNALTFPMSVGATAILFPDRVTPQAVADIVRRHGVTVFCGAPTLYSALLAAECAPDRGAHSLRLCLSAGESLPASIGRAWASRTGIDIVDGIGSTEMLHIYLSNRPGDIRYGTTGRPVDGYEVRLVTETGNDAVPGEMGELHVRGPTMAASYWNQAEKSAVTFIDGWMRTGDKFIRDENGRYVHCGRADDMLKVSGRWVSPTEVEDALLAHEAVLEAAVVGVNDAEGLVKSKGFVVVKPGVRADESLARRLQAFTKARLAPYKYPRLIEFVDDLPKTATGKIRRHALRKRDNL